MMVFENEGKAARRIKKLWHASISGSMVRARLHGEARDPARHPWKLIVKAVTYHGLEVGEHAGRWEARVFMDV